MNSPWSFITKRFLEPGGAEPTVVGVQDRREVQPRQAPTLLDGIGKRDELLRVRLSEMSERLEDLKSLGDDFSAMLAPMETISSELPVARARALELEAMLSQEVESGQISRREIDTLSARVTALSGEVSEGEVRTGRLETLLREREGIVEELRLSLRERSLLAEDADRQLSVEREQNGALSFELKSLRAEMQAADQTVLDSGRRISDLTERRDFAEAEVARLQTVAEDLNVRVVAAGSRADDLEQALEDALAAASGLEVQLAGEQAAHERTQSQYETELTAVRTDLSSLTMRAESLGARHAAVEQILGQVRGQLRDKEDALRLSDRTLKEAVSEKGVLERRLDVLREEVARRDGAAQDNQRQRGDLEDRCEMLEKTLAARDASLESAHAKGRHLSERIEALTLRSEKERQALEAQNRRLLEELQNERAERTLAQGALDIARESRLSLQRQNETLKRAARHRQGERDGASAEASPTSPSNVTFFPAGERKNEDQR